MGVYLNQALTRQQEISLGRVNNVDALGFYGEATAVDTTVGKVIDVWNGPTAGGSLYPGFPTAADTMSIVSTSVEDAAGLTGARSITLDGLDANGATQSVEYVLTGTTPVITTETWLRCFRARCSGTVGSTGSNVGTITIEHDVSGDVFGRIEPTKGSTFNAVWTVPAEWTALGSINMLNTRVPGGPVTTQELRVAVVTVPVNGPVVERFAFWVPSNAQPSSLPLLEVLQLAPLTDIYIQCTLGSVASLDVSVAMGFSLARNLT